MHGRLQLERDIAPFVHVLAVAPTADALPSGNELASVLTGTHLFATRRKLLVQVMGGVLTLVVAFVALLLWKTRPQRIFAAGFSTTAFGAVQEGTPEGRSCSALGSC